MWTLAVDWDFVSGPSSPSVPRSPFKRQRSAMIDGAGLGERTAENPPKMQSSKKQ